MLCDVACEQPGNGCLVRRTVFLLLHDSDSDRDLYVGLIASARASTERSA